MRDYGKVAPQFWTGATGKELRAHGHEAVIVGLYLMTSPHANMIGLYYLPVLYIAHETGLGLEGARKGLQRACEAGFCTYDDTSEYVFVHAMARFQIAPSLKPSDNRCKGVVNDLEKCPNPLFRRAFFDLYGEAFHIPDSVVEGSPLEGPSKPRAGAGAGAGAREEPNGSLSATPVANLPQCPHNEIIALYHEILPANPRIKVWDGARADHLRARWREDPKRQDLDYWRRYFSHVAASPFLTGKVDGQGGRPFLPGLDWLVKASNFAKVIEGRYHDRVAA